MIGLLGTATAKSYTNGTHRLVAPAETVARMRPFLGRLGITRIANVTGLDDIGIPVVQAVHPNARSLSVSQGKGIDLDAARASAIMESAEKWMAERVRSPIRWASADEVAKEHELVDLESLPRLGRPLSSNLRILWTEACELNTSRAVFVPYEMVHLDFTLPLPPGSGFFLGGSNGLASGNHPAEATSHAITEMIERDALTLLYQLGFEEQQARRLDLNTIDAVSCQDLLERYDRADVDVAVWDATSDIGVAVFLCSIVDRRWNDTHPRGPARGSGCHPDREVALLRALTEAAQSRLTRIVGSRDDLRPAQLERHRSLAVHQQYRAQTMLVGPPPRRFTETPSVRLGTFESEIRFLLGRLAQVGLGQVLALDLSHPEFPASVVRVIIPGLEGTAENPGYLPGLRARRARGKDVP